MKIVHGDEIEEVVRIFEHRKGVFRHRKLAAGEPGTPGNFSLEISRTGDDFFSPRHKHNFDQVRYQLEGEFDFDRNGKMTPGIVGYFPEGTPYGPQTSGIASLTLVLQFGGASGNGYMTQEQMETGIAELKKHGTFENGAYRREDSAEGKKNLDGYQAVWEQVNGRPMNYPQMRYHDPVMMNPTHFEWLAEGVSGVRKKPMGVFTERECALQFLQLDPRAKYRAGGRHIYFVLSGNGRLAGGDYRAYTTLVCEHGDEATFEASAPTEILVIGLPLFERAASHSIAAE